MNNEAAPYSIVPLGDYLHVMCTKHNQPCALSFHGFDPVMPLVEIRCPQCGSSGEWKLHGYDENYDLEVNSFNLT